MLQLAGTDDRRNAARLGRRDDRSRLRRPGHPRRGGARRASGAADQHGVADLRHRRRRLPRTVWRRELFAVYNDIPSYRTILDREGKATVADVALIGNEQRVGDQLAELADAGVTDFAAAVYGAPEERDRTMALLTATRRHG